MNYARYQKIVSAQLKKYGKPVTFHFQETGGGYDPISGRMTTSVIDEECLAVLVRPDKRALATQTVQLNDAALIIDGVTLSRAPNEKDTVTVDGADWRIISVSWVAPGDLTIIYKIYIRRS